jgi:Beta-propeller repeat
MKVRVCVPSTSYPARRARSRFARGAVLLMVAGLLVLVVGGEASAYSPGQRLWVKTYGTVLHQAECRAVATGPGGVVCAVGVQGRSGDDDWMGLVVKYGSGGGKLWARNYKAGTGTSLQICELTEAAFDPKGNIYVAGQRQYKGGLHPDYLVAKYSPAGKLLWARTYNGPNRLADYPSGLAVDSLGNVYVTGSSQVNGSTFAIATLKYNTNGTRKWLKRFAPPAGSVNARDLAMDGSRNVYVGGNHSVSPGNSTLVVKYSGATGSQLASAEYQPVGGYANGTTLAVRGTTVAIGGYGRASGATNNDAVVVAYTLALKPRYALLYDGPAAGTDAVYDIALDGKGNAYATGDDYVSNPYRDATQTFKVDPTGQVVWADSYLPPSNDSISECVVADGVGNAFVAGYADNASGYPNLLVIKYAATATGDPEPVWLKTWGGTYSVQHQAGIVLGPLGTLYIGGSGEAPTTYVKQSVLFKYAR